MKHTTPSESQMPGSNSLWNQKEIQQILGVAVNLMKNKFPPVDVTVLCPYRGQVFICLSSLHAGELLFIRGTTLCRSFIPYAEIELILHVIFNHNANYYFFAWLSHFIMD